MSILQFSWCWLPWLCLGQGLVASPPSETMLHRHGPVTLTTTAPVNANVVEINLADLLSLTVIVEGSGSVAVDQPPTLTPTPAWQTHGVTEPHLEKLDDGRARWRQTLVLEPLLPGTHEVRLAPFRWRQGEGDWQTVNWQAIVVQVATQAGTADIKDLRDITVIEDMPSTSSLWSAWLLLTVLVVGSSGMVVLAWWYGQRRKGKALPLNAAAWSQRRLDRLLALDLPAKNHGRRFPALLSQLLRAYLQKRFQLPARRRPTAEVVQLAAQVDGLTLAQQKLLTAILSRCDRAKFAPTPPSPTECAQLAQQARTFVRQTAQVQ